MKKKKFVLERETVQIATNLFVEKRTHMRNESFQPTAIIIDSLGQERRRRKKAPSPSATEENYSKNGLYRTPVKE